MHALRLLELDVADCSHPDCMRPAEPKKGGLCALHAHRAQRGTDLDAPVQERLAPFEAFVRAACDLADVDAEDDLAYARAIDNARKAGIRWMRSLGYTKTSATDMLAARIAEAGPRACKVPPRGSEQQKNSAQEAPRPQERPGKAVRQGRLGKPGRTAGVGEGDARARRQPCTGGDRPIGPADEAEKEPQRRARRRRGAAGSCGPEAVQPRAHRPRAQR